MVEVLVALALTSFLLIALGALVQVSGRVGERADATSQVLNVLLDLQSLANQLSTIPLEWQTASTSAGASAIVLTDGAEHARLFDLKLTAGDHAGALELIRDGQTSSIDLSVFDAALLEALVREGGEIRWVSLDAIGASRPLLVRLSARQGHRTWFSTLWAIGWNQK